MSVIRSVLEVTRTRQACTSSNIVQTETASTKTLYPTAAESITPASRMSFSLPSLKSQAYQSDPPIAL